MTTLQETLQAFSKKQASPEAVMRALCEYDGWFAPMPYALHAFKTNMFEKASIWGAESQVPAGKLYLFTDHAQGQLALEKVQLGGYVSPLSGATLFGALPAGFKELRVNPAAPPDQGWYMADDALQLAALWGQAIALENALSGKTKSDKLVDMMIDFPGYTTFSTPTGAIATAVGAAGMKNPAMVFTGPDCAAKAIEKFGAQASALKRVVCDGKTLFSRFPQLGIDGFLFNPFGPGPVKVFDEKLCTMLVESVASREELARLEAAATET